MNRWLVRTLVLVLLVDATGCSWWRHRREARHAREAATADARAPADAATPPAAPTEAAPVVASSDAVPVLTDADAIAARRLANDFYEMHARFAGRGLPDPSAMNAYGAFLCPSLVQGIEAARVRQKAFIAAHPDDKPPLVEGDLFSSLFEGVEHAQAQAPAAASDGVRVPVALSRGIGPGAQRWQDTLVLQRDDGVLCVADVEYGGGWAFANKGSLRDMLDAD